MLCAVCQSPAPLWRNVDGYDFTDCPNCEAVAIDQESMIAIDNGSFPRNYDPDYWAMEVSAARERSWGSSIVRVSEAILYSRRPIEKFVDIGSGPGFLLDSLSKYFPGSKQTFFGVEMFPPATHTENKNYIIGNLKDVEHLFDGGVCIEVFEHLTPLMLKGLAKAVAEKSNPGALYLINTHLSHGVSRDDPGYIDPLNRGHIISWSLKAISSIFSPLGFKTIPLRGRSWAFCLEYLGESDLNPEDRIWTPVKENLAILKDETMGDVCYIAGLDAARAYCAYE